MNVSLENLYFMCAHEWWLTAHSQLDSRLLIQQSYSNSDCSGIAAGCDCCSSLLHAGPARLEMRSFSSLFNVSWGSLSEFHSWSGVWSATVALRSKVKQVGLKCWHETKECILKEVWLRVLLWWFLFSIHWQEKGGECLLALTVY